jgi:predicted PhzF superfamily epimerase YddE/YHI9
VTALHVLRVFIGHDGSGGNPLGVFLDGTAVDAESRQRVAKKLGYSETVFVDDADRGDVRIFTPARELPFAGHPLVGAGWLLREEGHLVDALHPPAGEVPTWRDGAQQWIRARPEWVHPIEFDQLPTPEAVEALSGPPKGHDSYYAWAWEDEAAGCCRSRYFAAAVGIAEDEATGAAAVVLGHELGRAIEIRQGRGSRLLARPGRDGTVEVGGRVALDNVREFEPEAAQRPARTKRRDAAKRRR